MCISSLVTAVAWYSLKWQLSQFWVLTEVYQQFPPFLIVFEIMKILFYLLVFHHFIRIVKIHSGCTEILLTSFYYKELEVWINDGEKFVP